MPMITPIINALVIERKFKIKILAKNKTKTENKNPKIDPSQLLFGLTRGNNLCFPNLLPTQKATESHNHIDAKIEIIKYPPL